MIDFKSPILDIDGEVVKQKFKSSKFVGGNLQQADFYRDVLLEDLARLALLKTDDEKNPNVILKRYQLFRKVYHKGEVELTNEEKEMLKKYICKNHDIIFAGQALELIK